MALLLMVNLGLGITGKLDKGNKLIIRKQALTQSRLIISTVHFSPTGEIETDTHALLTKGYV